MTKDEALKLALDWLEGGNFVYPTELRTAIKEALAQPEQEAMRGWVKNDGEFHEAQLLGGKVTYGKPIGILTKMEGDETMKLYPFDPTEVQKTEVTYTGNGSAEWRAIEAPTGYFFPVDGQTQPEERNFCQRCGKRTSDLTTIHTCTPPQENT
jgi:hypothetical protein